MNSSNKAALLAVLLCAAPALAAAPKAAPAAPAERSATMEDTVAVVDGRPVLLSEYQKEAATALDYWSKTNPAALADPANVRKIREGTLEELITRELLVAEGERSKMKVRERELDNAVEEIKNRFRKDETGRTLDEAAAEKAFADQLKAEGIDYGQFRERLSRQIMARKVIDENVKSKSGPATEAEAKDYFEKVKAYIASKSTDAPKGMDDDEFGALREAAAQIKAMSSERVRVQRILIRLSPGASDNERKRALKTAEGLRKRLSEGEDFAKVAKEESEDPESAARGGDIGYVLRGVAPPEMEKTVFGMEVGQTSQPILTEIGYSILRVTEKRAAEAPEFDRFKEDLMSFLGNVNFRKKLDAYVKTLREKASIERHLPATP